MSNLKINKYNKKYKFYHNKYILYNNSCLELLKLGTKLILTISSMPSLMDGSSNFVLK